MLTTYPLAVASARSQVRAAGAKRRELPISAHALPHRTPRELLALARRGLAEAAETRADGLRYATAHLAALRAAASVLAARATAAPGRRNRLTSVWALLVIAAPEMSEWAAFFAAGAAKRAAAEAGVPRAVSGREADDLMRSAEQFVAVVEVALGLSFQPAPPPQGLAQARRRANSAVPESPADAATGTGRGLRDG